ncbi:MAG TPA: metalloregulator ArsR/SmtB family transcription factor [Vicinamibacteria bacterium]
MKGKLAEAGRLLRTLGNERRLRIVNALLRADLCVCELVDVLRRPQYEVSRDLAALRNLGLVEDRREGPWVYYSIPAGVRADALVGGLLRLLEEFLPAEAALRFDLACLERRLALRTGDRCVVGTPASAERGGTTTPSTC